MPKVDASKQEGRERRAKVPRSSHAEWVPAANRRDPVEVLMVENSTRVAELVPIRMQRMADSPFSFFRGAARVMALDLLETPRSGLQVQACGDAHLTNFGLFATPERKLVFDLNDFDETLPGPWEWDVKRLAASTAIVAKWRGFPRSVGQEAVRAGVSAYRVAMARHARQSVVDVFYEQLVPENVKATALERVRELSFQSTIAASRKRTSDRLLRKLAVKVDGSYKIVDNPPLINHIHAMSGEPEELRRLYDGYLASLPPERAELVSRYEVADFARKVVGVGSVGTRCFVALLIDPTGAPLFLQIKQAVNSVLQILPDAPIVEHHGERVTHGQRRMQAASDLFLGHSQALDFQAYVRQLADMKGSIDPAKIPPAALSSYIARCGEVLARAHARSGDPAAISGYLGKDSPVFDQAIVEYADRVSIQNELDHAELVQAVADGTVPVFTP